MGFDLNLARLRLTPDRMPAVITELARSRGWAQGRLDGVEVFLVLNAASPSGQSPRNERRTLRLFYERLIGAMGGTVAGFDTSLRFPAAVGEMAN